MTRYHFVGIKGTGMSALAQILHHKGFEVQGSDIEKPFFTEEGLRRNGIDIRPFGKENIEEGQTVIVGNAFGNDHEEVKAAIELGVPIYQYHHFLGKFMENYTSMAVTGAHGKTSTTGLLSHVLKGAEPTSYLIGDGTGFGEKEAKNFVFEACEYRRHFLAYHPDYAIMTNIDFDHPDYFSGLEDVISAFEELATQVKKAIIACGDDEHLRNIQGKAPIIFYGFGENNDFQARNVKKSTEGTTFDVYVRNNFYGTFAITGYGNHSVLNSLAVIAICHYENIPIHVIATGLATFGGVKRRFNEKIVGDQVLIDDYAHHPTEITVTIEAARQKYPDREIVAIFQPHTFTRTAKFLDDFATALAQSDKVYLCDIFGSARENAGEMTIETLREKIPNADLIIVEDVEKLKAHEKGVLLFMGAGDIQKFERAFEEIS